MLLATLKYVFKSGALRTRRSFPPETSQVTPLIGVRRRETHLSDRSIWPEAFDHVRSVPISELLFNFWSGCEHGMDMGFGNSKVSIRLIHFSQIGGTWYALYARDTHVSIFQHRAQAQDLRGCPLQDAANMPTMCERSVPSPWRFQEFGELGVDIK